MTTEELVERLNQNQRIHADNEDGDIAVCNDTGHVLFMFSDKATSFLDFTFNDQLPSDSMGKTSREYVAAQIEEYLQTPIEKRKPEKKYNLYLGLIAGTRDTEYWLMKPAFPNDTTPFQLARDRKNPRTIWTEDEVDKLKWQLPVMKEAIEKMKVPADGAKSLE